MKKVKATLLCAALLLLAACNNEDVFQQQPPTPGQAVYKATITATIDGNDTRLGYQEYEDEGQAYTKITWDEGTDETFSLVAVEPNPDDNNHYLFRKTSPEAGATATFEYQGTAALPTEGEFYVVYPGSELFKVNSDTIDVDFSVRHANDKSGHFLMGEIEIESIESWEDISLNFEHKVALMMLTITSPELEPGDVIREITIQSPELIGKGTYTFADGSWTSAPSNPGKITSTHDIIVDGERKATVYLAIPPCQSGEIKVTAITADAATYEGNTSLLSITPNAGTVYNASVSMTKLPAASMKFTIKTIDPSSEFVIPIDALTGTYTLTVDWGDGNSDPYSSGTAKDAVKHTYTDAGTYQITVTSSEADDTQEQMPRWSVDLVYPFPSVCNYLVSMDTPMLNMGSTTLESCFYNCGNLTFISAGLFDKNTAVTDFKDCFYYCEKLTSIPEGLFDNNTEATDFGSCFSRCRNLTSIPAGLFDYNTEATSFYGCFNYCGNLTSIPEGLFDKNTEATSFGYCFNYCTSLKLNSNIFCNETTEKSTRFADKIMNFDSCFEICGASLTADDIAESIARALWDYEMIASSSKTDCFTDARISNAGDVDADWGIPYTAP